MLGSAAFVARAIHPSNFIRAALLFDMAGYVANASSPFLWLETLPRFAPLQDALTNASAFFFPRVSRSQSPFGSDHVSFLDAGIPAILLIDGDWAAYPYYHNTQDTPDKIVSEQALAFLRYSFYVLHTMKRSLPFFLHSLATSDIPTTSTASTLSFLF